MENQTDDSQMPPKLRFKRDYKRVVRHDSINHNVYLDGEFKRINFETITEDQKKIFYDHFRGRNFRSQKVSQVIQVDEVTYENQTMINSLNLTSEEQGLISKSWIKRLRSDYDRLSFDPFAQTLQYRILVLECKNGVICGFQKYGEEFAKNGTKYVCHKDDHFERLIEDHNAEIRDSQGNVIFQIEDMSDDEDITLMDEDRQNANTLENINEDEDITLMDEDGQITDEEFANEGENNLVNNSVPSENSVNSSNAELEIITEQSRQLIDAVKNGNAEFIKQLIESDDNVDIKDERGTPLAILAIKNPEIRQNQDLIELLLEHVENIDARDAEGFTILMHAVEEGDEYIVHLLIDFGANVNAIHNDKTAILIAQDLKTSTQAKFKKGKAKEGELEDKIKKYKKIIKLFKDYREFKTKELKLTNDDGTNNDNNESSRREERQIDEEFKKMVDTVVERYNKNDPNDYKGDRTVVTDFVRKKLKVNGKILKYKDIRKALNYAKNKGMLEASSRANRLKKLICRVRKTRRWNDVGIAHRYGIRDYDVLIVTKDEKKLSGVRYLYPTENRMDSLTAEDQNLLKKEVNKLKKEGFLSDYGICCKFNITKSELEKINENLAIDIHEDILKALNNKAVLDKGDSSWNYVVNEWNNASFNLQEQLKKIVDPNYKLKSITKKYIEENVGGSEKGIDVETFNDYSSKIDAVMSGKLIKTNNKSYLIRFVNYSFAQKTGQKFYKDKNNELIQKMYESQKSQQAETLNSEMKVAVNAWLKMSHEQRVKLATRILLPEEDENSLKKWTILLQNTDVDYKKLMDTLKSNNFKRSDFVDVKKLKLDNNQIDYGFARTQLSRAKGMKRLIQYIINLEKSDQIDDMELSDSANETKSIDSDDTPLSQRKRRANPNLSSLSKTQPSKNRKV